MPAQRSQVITQEQINDMRQQRDRIPQIKQELAMAKRAGIDVTDQEAELARLETQLNALLRVYDPARTAGT